MLERAPVRGGVDATREPRGDDETFEPEFACKLAREFLSRRGAVARADDGDDGKGGELNAALDLEKRRRRIDMGERRGIARLAERNERYAQTVGAGKFGFGLGFGAKPDVVGPAAPPRQRRERGNGRFGPAELVDESAEGRGANVLAADQPEPGKTLTAVEPRAGLR